MKKCSKCGIEKDESDFYSLLRESNQTLVENRSSYQDLSRRLKLYELDKCPTCGGEVYQREDDKADVIKRRLEVYTEQTAPIIAFYRNEGLLISISAVGSVEAITDQAKSALANVAQ